MFALPLAVLLAAPEIPERFVTLDWSGVPDAVITRCDLRGLGNDLLQRIVDGGFAVVDSIEADTPPGAGATLRLEGQRDRIVLHAARGEVREQRDVPLPKKCDSAVLIDLGYEATALLEKIFTEEIATAVAEELPAVTTGVPPPTRALHVWAGAELIYPGAEQALGEITAEVRYRPVDESWAAGASFSTAFGGGDQIVIIEPRIGAHAFYLIDAGVMRPAVGIEAALVFHAFDAPGGGDARADGRFALRFELQTSFRAKLAVGVFFRTARIEHRITRSTGQRTVFTSEIWGITVGLGGLILREIW